MRLRHALLIAALSVFPLAGIAAAAIPGPQRMLAPELYGLHQIAPGVFIDNLTEAPSALAMISASRQSVAAFFGELHASPRYVLCSSLTCSQRFGESGGVARSFGWSAIAMPHKALEDKAVGQSLFTHELVHSELLYRWGATALFDKRIPNWFNEGLATWVARDARVSFAASETDKAWIRQSLTFWDWGQFVDAHGWAKAYGAAASNIADIDRSIGQDGLRQLISRSLAGENFDAVLRELLAS